MTGGPRAGPEAIGERSMGADDGRIRIGGQHPFATPAEWRSAARRFRGRLVAPVTVWTAGGTGDGAGLTVSSVLVADGEPARLLGLIDPASAFWEAMRRAGAFVVHVLGEADRALAERVALGSGARRRSPTSGLPAVGVHHRRILRAGGGRDRGGRAARPRRPAGLAARELPVGARPGRPRLAAGACGDVRLVGEQRSAEPVAVADVAAAPHDGPGDGVANQPVQDGLGG